MFNKGVLLKSHRDMPDFRSGMEQFGVRFQCTRRDMAGDPPFREGKLCHIICKKKM